ncbi:MAG: hypothetical protein GC145_06275 [Caulobacter sp.]|nr:hypothetical protein [Caulobacter sp.]
MPLTAWIALAALFVTISLQGVGFAFFMGRLSQRVQSLEKTSDDEAGMFEKFIRLDEQMKVANKNLEAMDRHLQGINRQLANLGTANFKASLAGEHD